MLSGLEIIRNSGKRKILDLEVGQGFEILSVTSPLVISAAGVLSMPQADTDTDGYLSFIDWNTFNNKQPAGNYVPHTGANQAVNLNTQTLTAGGATFGNVTATSFIKSGGTNSQFLKADGSVDSNTYALDANVWKVAGNAGTVAGTNFIGTTDAQDLVFKRNSTEIVRLNSTGLNMVSGFKYLYNGVPIAYGTSSGGSYNWYFFFSDIV